MNEKSKGMPRTLYVLFSFIFLFILFGIFLASPKGEKAAVFIQLEFISYVDNLLEDFDSPLLGNKSRIEGKGKEFLFKNQDQINKPALYDWIKRSRTDVLLIAHKGELVFEFYDENSDGGLKNNGFSMAKTVTALVTGIALNEGLIESVDDSIQKYLPEIKLEQDDSIRIRDLLQQRSGLSDSFLHVRDTLAGKSLDNRLEEISFSKDKKFRYSNINYHLLSLILKTVYKKELSQILSEKLWKPLNLSDAYVVNETAYCCIYANADAWLALGKLLIDEGVYEGKEVVPTNWIKQMKQDYTEPEKFMVQLTSRSKKNLYSYHLSSGLKEYPNAYWTEGMGLQLVLVIPEKDVLVVRLGDLPSVFKNNTNRLDESLASGLYQVIESL
jgi:CubicO group peptidase (beta-lactamase class C family)